MERRRWRRKAPRRRHYPRPALVTDMFPLVLLSGRRRRCLPPRCRCHPRRLRRRPRLRSRHRPRSRRLVLVRSTRRRQPSRRPSTGSSTTRPMAASRAARAAVGPPRRRWRSTPSTDAVGGAVDGVGRQGGGGDVVDGDGVVHHRASLDFVATIARRCAPQSQIALVKRCPRG